MKNISKVISKKFLKEKAQRRKTNMANTFQFEFECNYYISPSKVEIPKRDQGCGTEGVRDSIADSCNLSLRRITDGLKISRNVLTPDFNLIEKKDENGRLQALRKNIASYSTKVIKFA